MIVDNLSNLGYYAGVNPLFGDIVDFLKTHDLLALEPGKHIIKEGELFVNITTTRGKTREEAVMETHRRMLDIQIPLDAEETYGYIPLDQMPDAEYNAEKDVTKYPGLQGTSYVICRPGMMAIFFPQDGHQPCIGTAPEIRKAIFKVVV